jgi:hypothetical protein
MLIEIPDDPQTILKCQSDEIYQLNSQMIANIGDWVVKKDNRIIAIFHSEADAITFSLGRYVLNKLNNK